MTESCTCACHVGGAYRPACDVPGGCGPHSRRDGTGQLCCLPHRHEPERPRRALDGALVCRGCAADLQRILDGEDRHNAGVRDRVSSIGELWLELAEILPAGSQGTGVAVSGSREPALPFQPLVSTHMATIRDQLCAWAVQHCDERGETGPRNTDPTTVGPWLAARLDWAMRQDWIPDYADELRRMRGRALSLLDPVKRARVPVAWCPTPGCDGGLDPETGVQLPGVLVADIVRNDPLLPSAVYCSAENGCKVEWPPHRWMELGRKVRAKSEGAA